MLRNSQNLHITPTKIFFLFYSSIKRKKKVILGQIVLKLETRINCLWWFFLNIPSIYFTWIILKKMFRKYRYHKISCNYGRFNFLKIFFLQLKFSSKFVIILLHNFTFFRVFTRFINLPKITCWKIFGILKKEKTKFHV